MNRNIEALLRPNIKGMRPYSSARNEYTGRADVFLDANENPYDSGVNRYPDPLQKALKKSLAQLRGVSEDKLFIGNGSDEVLDLFFRAFCRPGVDNVISLPPTYGMYKVLAELNDVELREVPLIPETFQLDLPALLDCIDSQTKMIFLCSPNNPTGNTLEVETIEKLLKSWDGIVLIDEAYIDFSDQTSWIERIEEYPKLVVSQTLSKAWGMAGLRLGLGICSTQIIDILNRVKPPYNIGISAQQQALMRVRDYSTYSLQLERILEQREMLAQALENFSTVEKVYPSQANFLLVKWKDSEWVYNALRERGIVLRDRSSQIHCDQCLRISVGRPEENNYLLENLKSIEREARIIY